MKVFSLILDVIFFIAALTLFGYAMGLVDIPKNYQFLLIGIVSGFSVAYSVLQIFEDVKDKPEKYKGDTTSDSIKNPFKK